ncbi:hypothetical protein NW768_007382 [Fusarium equiseti]|uniref:Uncharacterized protein n=1 Tax=Fusarium equiseti TaxID=61235 RepID=A0ABQ8R818_FUSEQ|nr:hypothetical protein NW768_007382 [Fusarium equiseti]
MAPLKTKSQPKTAVNTRRAAPKRATTAATRQLPHRPDMILAMNDPYMQQIIDGVKNYEFRKYEMAGIQRIWFYRTAPHSAITHICPVKEAVTREDGPLPEDGLGNKDYNEGHPDYEGWDFAYRINEVYEINSAITLEMMKNEHGMKGAPQGRMRLPDSIKAQYRLEDQTKII